MPSLFFSKNMDEFLISKFLDRTKNFVGDSKHFLSREGIAYFDEYFLPNMAIIFNLIVSSKSAV